MEQSQATAPLALESGGGPLCTCRPHMLRSFSSGPNFYCRCCAPPSQVSTLYPLLPAHLGEVSGQSLISRDMVQLTDSVVMEMILEDGRMGERLS